MPVFAASVDISGHPAFDCPNENISDPKARFYFSDDKAIYPEDDVFVINLPWQSPINPSIHGEVEAWMFIDDAIKLRDYLIEYLDEKN